MVVRKIAEHTLKIGAKLVPPAETAAEKLLLWRLTLVAFNTVLAFIVMVHIAWACGFLPGFSGFAVASDIEDIKKDSKGLKQVILEKEIIDTAISHCHSKPETRAFYYARLIDLLKQHREIVGTQFEKPNCTELGVEQ